MDEETTANLAGTLRRFGLAAFVPGGVLALIVEIALGTLGNWPLWPAVVAGTGMLALGGGTLLDTDQVIEEADDVEFDHYAVETPGKAILIGRSLLLAGALVFVAGLLP